MLLAGRVLAATVADLMRQPERLQRARAELSERRGERPYRSLLAPGQPPPLDYRNDPR